MTKTTTRQRAVNLYTVESNGQPVAQAMAIHKPAVLALLASLELKEKQ